MENKKLIHQAIQFIQANPQENLSLQSIADHAGFSLTYFEAIFRQHTGYTPVEYARVYKLTRSALALRRTDKTILDIALDFGYGSPESFARAFKNFYSLSPSQYREKYATTPVSWHDLSGKIAISQFRRNFPELQPADVDSALDFCFTHNPLKYAEDIVGMTVTETEVLTLGNTDSLAHFVYVSDYNSAEPSVTLVCEEEQDALAYLKLLAKLPVLDFNIRKSLEAEWDAFDAEVAKLGLTCRVGYDMLYTRDTVAIPEYADLTARILTAEDMPLIQRFKQDGGCAECHARAMQISFCGRGNTGLKPVGVFQNGALVCLAMPTLDEIRELRKYDIGAVFALDHGSSNKAIEFVWKYAIAQCLDDNAIIGNANAKESNAPTGMEISQQVGLVKVAKNCRYCK